MSHLAARPSVQSRLLSKKVNHSSTPQMQSRPGPDEDPVLAGIVARLKAEVKQASERPKTGPCSAKAVYDPFSSYHHSPEGKVGTVFLPTNRPTTKLKMDKTNSSTTCICNRPRQLVMCQHCGETFEGRVKMTCPTHPSVTYLLDVVACRGCKMDDVKALKEFPMMK